MAARVEHQRGVAQLVLLARRTRSPVARRDDGEGPGARTLCQHRRVRFEFAGHRLDVERLTLEGPDGAIHVEPQVFDVLQGVDGILHGGDIHELVVLDQLNELAPLWSARGNGEDGSAGRPIAADDARRLQLDDPPQPRIAPPA